MKKILLFLIILFSFQFVLAQPAGILGETFNLKSIRINNTYLTPNGENPNFTIQETAGSYSVEANGIENIFSAEVTFNGDTLTLHSPGITSGDCNSSNCYFEDFYFYNLLTNQNLESKTLTFNYSESNGIKNLSLRNADYNIANFSTEPPPQPDPLLFQTWYLYMVEADLGDVFLYDGPNPPQITINPDFTYNGVEDCSLISGDFILGNASDYSDFVLQPHNHSQDTSNCPPGPVNSVFSDYETGIILPASIYPGSNDIDLFEYYPYPGFIYFFRNKLILTTPENRLDKLSIFPNPVHDRLFIKYVGDFDSVSITDINGRIVKSLNDAISNELDVSELSSGMYFILITSSEGNITKKFLKN